MLLFKWTENFDLFSKKQQKWCHIGLFFWPYISYCDSFHVSLLSSAKIKTNIKNFKILKLNSEKLQLRHGN